MDFRYRCITGNNFLVSLNQRFCMERMLIVLAPPVDTWNLITSEMCADVVIKRRWMAGRSKFALQCSTGSLQKSTASLSVAFGIGVALTGAKRKSPPAAHPETIYQSDLLPSVASRDIFPHSCSFGLPVAWMSSLLKVFRWCKCQGSSRENKCRKDLFVGRRILSKCSFTS